MSASNSNKADLVEPLPNLVTMPDSTKVDPLLANKTTDHRVNHSPKVNSNSTVPQLPLAQAAHLGIDQASSSSSTAAISAPSNRLATPPPLSTSPLPLPHNPSARSATVHDPTLINRSPLSSKNASPVDKGTVELQKENLRKDSPLDPLRRLFHTRGPHGRGAPLSSVNHSQGSSVFTGPSPAPSVSTEGSLREKYGRQCRILGQGTGGTVRVFRRTVGGRPRINPFGGSLPAATQRSDVQITKLYAVKEFRKRNPNEDQRKYIKRLTAEYCIASTLHHENIIETLDIVFENNRAYVIMDYCPHDLFYLLASENALFTTDSAVDCYFAQLLQGVGYLHQAGIAHLDLKLENCVVAPNGTLKIIDFGCAEVVRAPWEMRTRQCEKAKGSQPYVAPEVYLSHPFNGQFADAWAVGLTFICMVERHYPWRIARPSTDDAYRRYSEMRSIADASDKAAFAKDEKMEQDSKEPSMAGSNGLRYSQPPVANGSVATYMRRLLPGRPEAWRVISGLLCPNASRRWTIAQALDDKWVRQIEICHDQHPATHHRHPGCEGPLIK